MPFGKQEKVREYFFALNITHEKLTCALWTIQVNQLKILDTASSVYSSLADLTGLTDKLLDESLGIREIEPQKILFGVPSSWLSDETLKDEYLKVFRQLVKDLELTPMAYVENSHALVHFLERTDGIPPTAILVGFETRHLTVSVVRSGKLDGVKMVSRGENSGTDIEKALLTFAAVETLPSKILIYGSQKEGLEKLKSQLLSYPWMSKLSFLHLPKIEILQDDVEIKSICFAGASEIQSNVIFTEHVINQAVKKTPAIDVEDSAKEEKKEVDGNLGFMVGDISDKQQKEQEKQEEEFHTSEAELMVARQTRAIEIEDFEHELPAPKPAAKKFLPANFKGFALLAIPAGILLLILTAYLLLPKAEVKIFIEPKILEKDATVTADPNQKTVNEDARIIPAQIVDIEVSGSAKELATGKKQIGDPAKGTVVIYNKTYERKSLSKGTILTSSGGAGFTIDTSVNMASQSASESGITFGKASTTVTAQVVGADGNLPSGADLSVAGFTTVQVTAKAEGNFSGGTSKEATVVSSDDQQKLLASLASNLRQQAQQKLQEKLPEKKILAEALSEDIVKKSFNKNINDQASEFSLNLTAKYKGIAFEDKDLKIIVSKLVITQVPDGFQLNLEDTETQADVSKVEKDGKLIFLAKFKAKLTPKIDTDSVRKRIKGKGVSEAAQILKGMENVLGSEIKISPKLPGLLQRLPMLSKNIKIEAGLK